MSIVSRGMAGGFTRYLPEEDRHLMSKSQFKDMLAASLGGLCAEELILNGESTTGPSDDLNKATNIARNMVTQWGMSERLGPRTFGNKQELVFLGREIGEQRNYSEKVAEEIDEEVRRLVDHAYQTARTLLTDNRDRLDTLVKILLDVENIEGEDLQARAGRPRPASRRPPPTRRRRAAAASRTSASRTTRRARSRSSVRPASPGVANRTSRWTPAARKPRPRRNTR